MTAGALLITAVVSGVWMVLASGAKFGCFFLMCWTILVYWRKKNPDGKKKEIRQTKAQWRLGVMSWLGAHLAAVLFGAMRTTDRRSGDGSGQLGVCA